LCLLGCFCSVIADNDYRTDKQQSKRALCFFFLFFNSQ
jgi:hypothetical protein